MMKTQEETWALRRQMLRESELDSGTSLLERGKRILQGLLFGNAVAEITRADRLGLTQRSVCFSW